MHLGSGDSQLGALALCALQDEATVGVVVVAEVEQTDDAVVVGCVRVRNERQTALGEREITLGVVR